jgi:hypothetical protein
MAVFLRAVVFNGSDIDRAAEFCSKALCYAPQLDDPAFLAPKSGGGPRLHLDENDRTYPDLWVGLTSVS